MRPSIGWQLRFLKGFIGGSTAEAPPFALVVDVTRRCNLACLHCRVHSPLALHSAAGAVTDFPLDTFLSLCGEAKEWGIRKIVFLGEGEPLLHPGLQDMVAAAKGAGCRVVLLTNGTLLERRLADEFVKAGLDELRVSLWASDEEEYGSLNPGTRPEMFHRTLEGVRLVAAAKQSRGSLLPKLVLHRPVDPDFLGRLDGTLDLAEQTGCDAVSFSPLKPFLSQDLDRMLTAGEERELTLMLTEVAKKAGGIGLAHNTAEVLRRLRIGRAVWEKIPCYIGWIDLRIRVDGDVVPCDACDRVMGNVHHDGIREIWNNPNYREFRRITRRRDGMIRSGINCRCDFCCHAVANDRLHQLLRWLPLASSLSEENRHDQIA